MDFTNIIIRPLHTEKTYAMESAVVKQFAFIVDIKASKYDIALAISTIYGVHPVSVNTKIKKSKATRTATKHPGFTSDVKVAYVTFPADAVLPGMDAEVAAEKGELAKEILSGELEEKDIKPVEQTVEELKEVVAQDEIREPIPAIEVKEMEKAIEAEASETRIPPPSAAEIKDTEKALAKEAGIKAPVHHEHKASHHDEVLEELMEEVERISHKKGEHSDKFDSVTKDLKTVHNEKEELTTHLAKQKEPYIIVAKTDLGNLELKGGKIVSKKFVIQQIDKENQPFAVANKDNLLITVHPKEDIVDYVRTVPSSKKHEKLTTVKVHEEEKGGKK